MNTVQINRGIPGSGKSTLTETLSALCSQKNLKMAVHSTDSLLMVNGVYTFVAEKMGYFHNLNFENFKVSLDAGVNLVVVDNTNILQKDFMHYVNAAKGRGYKVAEVFFYPDALEKHVARNVHRVPAEAIERMYKRLMGRKDNPFGDFLYEIFPPTYLENIEATAKSIVDNL